MRKPGSRFVRAFVLAFLVLAVTAVPCALAQTLPEPERVTFELAIARALERNPGIAEAAQSILQAEALLQQVSTVYRPTVNGNITTSILDSERGFNDLVTQPRTQSLFGVSVSYPVLAASRWAQRVQAEDQIRVARLGVEEARRQVAIATAQSYLSVINLQRQVEVALLARENAVAHVDYARARLQAGAGSRLNELRAAQELASDEVFLEATRILLRRAQEALGVLLAADGPVDAVGEPALEVVAPPTDTSWLMARADIQLINSQISAADRVYRDSWRDWVPTASVSFEPQLLTPSGLFTPSQTWRGFVALSVPIFDGGSRRATKQQRAINVETARIQLTDAELQARSDLRTSQAALEINERALQQARLSAQHAAEVLRITDISFREGGTTNIELIDAQRRARDADTVATQAEDRVRQARLDILVALGRFPR